jgi:hypothetical protein
MMMMITSQDNLADPAPPEDAGTEAPTRCNKFKLNQLGS